MAPEGRLNLVDFRSDEVLKTPAKETPEEEWSFDRLLDWLFN